MCRALRLHDEGKRENLLENLRSMMETLGLTGEQALAALKVPEAEWADYLPQLLPMAAWSYHTGRQGGDGGGVARVGRVLR